MPNRLAVSASPYLRQHADNPVDWFPWGEEALAKARAEEKPIFLSIGYSTCHWCHVMAHESFENAGIAALLNEHFVAIKLDREERPDVDRVYMAYVQALTGHGGWPLSAWLTPELKPFYAGTYFPPEDRGGRAGFPSVLKAIARGWREDRAALVAESERVVETLRSRAGEAADGTSTASADPMQTLAEGAGQAFEKGIGYYADIFDPVRGGFGGAPKFPRPANLAFLLRCAALQGPQTEVGREALNLVTTTLGAMARGGIHDHVGGGFHRYAVDEDWFVPHFEKMLYDQAQIAVNALEGWQASGDERLAWLARDILDYALRDMRAPGGGFYSAEDADSSRAEGGHAEGAFYVWTWAELERELGADTPLFAAHFGVKPGGNVSPERDPQGEFTGRNILAQQRSLVETAAAFGVDPQAASDRLVSALERLRAARGRRPRPFLDDKILASWNGLMISALARAAAMPAESLEPRRAAYREAAVRAAAYLEAEQWNPAAGTLRRVGPSLRAGSPPRDAAERGDGEGFAEDYAFVAQGLLDLYEATWDRRWLAWAEALQRRMDGRFWDSIQGGYFNSAEGATDVILRLKENYDGAEPAPSSIAALNLLRLADLVGDEEMRRRGRKTLAAFRAEWQERPQGLPQMLCALEPALEPPRHVVLTGDPASPEFAALAAVLRETIGPRRTVIALDAGDGTRAWWSARFPWLAEMGAGATRPAAYACEAYACQAPASTPEELRTALRA